jgi:tRNA G10  N-methylase Trm11
MKEKQPKGKYHFVTVNQNYEDYSSGRVFYGASGATNFPVRLSSEIFQRCVSYLDKSKKEQSYVIWDAFCGVAYSMTSVGFLHNLEIRHIYASDTDAGVLQTASKNLSLLKIEGLNRRIDELRVLKRKFKNDIQTTIFQHNAITQSVPSDINGVDIVIVDLPYGQLTKWDQSGDEEKSTQIFLNKIKTCLSKGAVVAIVTNKKQKITYSGYCKLKTLVLGKRKIWFVKLIS